MHPEIKAQYIQLFTDMMVEVEPYFRKIKPEKEDLDFNTSFHKYLYLKCVRLNNAGRTAQAIVAEKQMNSIRNFMCSHHSSITDVYLSASQVLFEHYEAGDDDFAYPIAILGINYANEYNSDKEFDTVQKIYNHTVLKCVDILAKKNFEKYGFLEAIAYIEYARFNADTDIKEAEYYYFRAAKILINLLSYSSSINGAPSVLFNLASEIMLFTNCKNTSSKLLKDIYILLTNNKNLKFEEGGYFYILKLWYITQCRIADKKYKESLKHAERLERLLTKSNVSYYPERFSLYKLLEQIYKETDEPIDAKRCQILAENIKKICKFTE